MNTIMNYGTNMNAMDIAIKVFEKCNETDGMWDIVGLSPEPLRSMMYVSGVVENVAKLDGSDFYAEIVDCLEEIY